MKTIFAWHVHHDTLFEPLTERIENRIEYIKRHKPTSERGLRLRLLKPVEGELPSEVVKAWETGVKTWKVCAKAWEAYNKALATHGEEIEKLHQQECPDCPWDGKTIFA